MNRLKDEKGSITLFVLIAMLFFVLFLSGMYMLNASKETSQIEQVSKIKQIYEQDLNQIDNVYESLQPQGDYVVTYQINSVEVYGDLYLHDITMNLKNNTEEDINSWQIALQKEDANVIACNEAEYLEEEDQIVFTNLDDNAEVLANKKVSFNVKIATPRNIYKPVIKEVIPNPEEEKLLEITFIKTNDWMAGNKTYKEYKIQIKNTQENKITSWKFDLALEVGAQIQSAWDIDYTNSGNTYTLKNRSYNGEIESESEISIGITIVQTQEQDLELEATNIQIEPKPQ